MHKIIDFALHNQKVISSAVVLVIFYLLRFISFKIFDRKIENVRKRYLIRQTISYVAIFILTLTFVVIWVDWFRTVITFFSLVLGALILTSKEVISNFLAYSIIIWRSLFQVGDRIQIGSTIGDVLEVGPMYINVSEISNWVGADDYTGRMIKIPNSAVLTMNVSNYSKSSSIIWDEVNFYTTSDVNLQKAKTIALEIISKYHHVLTKHEIVDIESDKGDLMFLSQTPEVFITMDNNRIKFACRYACKFTKRRSNQNHIFEELITEFQKADDIQFWKESK